LNKNDRKAFKEMFSIGRLYNSACSYASIPIRIYPIMMSIAVHHYKILNDNILLLLPIGRDVGNSNHNSIILNRTRQMEN